MDDLEWSKIVGGVCGALLIYLVVHTGAKGLYSVEGGGHGHGAAEAAVTPASVYASAEAEAAADGAAAEEAPNIEELMAAADIEKGAKVFSKCKACHKLEDGANGVGPHLFSLVNRPVGSVDGFAYSNGMGSFDGNWDYANLNAFLEKPKGLIADTKMSFAGLRKPQDRADIIAYLETIK